MSRNHPRKKLKILCLHGHGASGKILKELMKDWPQFVMEMMDLVFLDAPFRTEESSQIGRFDPPYYEWFKDSFMGSLITGALPGMQREGVAFTKIPKVKFLILICGLKLGGKFFQPCPSMAENAFSVPIDLPSLFMIGEEDNTKEEQFELLESFVHPTLYYHQGGHDVRVPRTLDENGVKIVSEFLKKIQAVLLRKKNKTRNPCFHQYFCFVCSLFGRKVASHEESTD